MALSVSQLVFIQRKPFVLQVEKLKKNSYRVSGDVQVMHCRRQTCLMASLLHWNDL